MLLTMVSVVHLRTTTSSVPPVVVLSLWTVLDLGMPTDLATTIPRTTRTGGADCTRLAQMLLTMVMAALMPITTSSVPKLVVPNLWTVWDLGKPMESVRLSALSMPLP